MIPDFEMKRETLFVMAPRSLASLNVTSLNFGLPKTSFYEGQWGVCAKRLSLNPYNFT